MADFDLSMIVRVEDGGAAAAGSNLERTIDGVAAAEQRAAGAATALGRATADTATEFTRSSGAARGASDAVALNERVTRSNAAAQQAAARAIGQQRAAMSQLNFQIQDVTQGIALGVSPFVILAQQGGQFFDALQNLLGAQNATTTATQNQSRAAQQLAGTLVETNRATTNLENKTVQLAAADAAASGAMTNLTRVTGQHAAAAEADAIATGTAATAQLEFNFAASSGTGAVGGNTTATNANTAAKEANAIASGAAGTAAAGLAGAEARTAGAMAGATGATNANTAALEANAIANGTAGAAATGFGAVAQRVAAFMASGWGAALIAAASIVGMFAFNMTRAKDAMKLAETGADALGQAQSVLGGIFDMVSGKVERQNSLLIANARLTAINLRAEALQAEGSSRRTFRQAVQPRGGAFGSAFSAITGRSNRQGQQLLGPHIERIRNARTPEERSQAIDRALRETENLGTPGVAGSDTDPLRNLTNISTTEWRQALIDAARADQNRNVADAIDRSLNGMSLDPALRRDGPNRRPRRQRDQTAARERLEEFGEDAANRIANITGRFAGQPRLIEQAAAAMRQLDDIVDDINRRRPPNLQQLLADAAEARVAIREGVNRPYNDFIQQQTDNLEIARLITAGRNDEAEALRITLGLEREMGALTPERKEAVLATVQALREEERQLAAVQARQEASLRAVGEIRESVLAVIRDPVQGLQDLPGRLVNAFANLRADQLFEEMFGQTFRDIEDRIRGADVAEGAAERMAAAVDRVSNQTDQTTSALDNLAGAAERAAVAVGAGPAGAISGIAAPAGFTIGNPLLNMLVRGTHGSHTARGSHGVDLRAAIGTDVLAPFDGVLSSNTTRAGGLQAFLTSLDGRFRAGFAHLSDVTGDLGRVVRAGERIARTGNSGGVNPHLHASFRVDGQPVDPMQWFGRTIADAVAQGTGGTGAAAVVQPGTPATTTVPRAPGTDAPHGEGQVVVSGQRSPTAQFSGWIERLARGLGIGQSQSERDRLRAQGVTLSDDAATKIGKFAGKAIEGAATGQMVNSILKPIGKALGIRTSDIGAQIGGAVGSFIPIPGGDIIGSVVGSLLGGLFSKVKTGVATITSAYGDARIGGNSDPARKAVGGMATTIQDTILNIAEALGGGLGSFNVSIGQRDGRWRVDPTGRGRVKAKGGVKDFGEDADAALAFAVMDAIKDGAVTGLSAAVSQALKSSDDVERALREALKVRDLELLIGGLGSKLKRQFDDFDRVAQERVRLARKYGLDVITVERINAEQRAELLDNLLKSRIGGLLDFQNEMKFGDLFEGDAPTRRAAILEEIAKVQKDAEEGKEGAADQLADLFRRLIGTSEEAFGTAGPELASDRSQAADAIARVIQLEQDRINQAAGLQQAQTDALNLNNTLTNETNNLIAITNARLLQLAGGGGGGGFGGGSSSPFPQYGMSGMMIRETNVRVF